MQSNLSCPIKMGSPRVEIKLETSHRLLVSLLCFIFGFGSWVAMTGLWVEIPILVQHLPEGPALASNLSLALQAANVFCILYFVAWKYWPYRRTEDISIHAMLAIGSLSCFLLIFFWDKTVSIGSNRISISLYVLAFGLSIVDCASSVVFLPFMGRFSPVHMAPYLSGEGMGGFLPSLAAIAQGVGNEGCSNRTITTGLNVTETEWTLNPPEPRFPASSFMIILLIIVLLSWSAFILLTKLPIVKKQQIPKAFLNQLDLSQQNHITSVPPNQVSDLDHVTFKDGHQAADTVSWMKPTKKLSRTAYWYLMTLQGWACLATFGIFPAVQPFSCLPYGVEPFHLSVTLAALAYPLACLIALFVEVRGIKGISILTLLATAISVYIMATALLNPRPPLVGTRTGNVLLVLSWILLTGIFSYVKTMITIVMQDEGHSALLWVGAVTQFGGLFGAMFMVVLVNLTDLFNDQICFE